MRASPQRLKLGVQLLLPSSEGYPCLRAPDPAATRTWESSACSSRRCEAHGCRVRAGAGKSNEMVAQDVMNIKRPRMKHLAVLPSLEPASSTTSLRSITYVATSA